MSPAPVLVVHGGAGRSSKPEDRVRYMAAVAAALDAGSSELAQGAGPAVIAAVEYMERDPALNAGLGAVLDADGRVLLDAGFMEGTGKRYGAVTCVTRCITPVVLARRLSEDGDFGRFIAGDAADRLAARWNVAPCDPDELVTTRSRARHLARAMTADTDPGADTVGAVALDAAGHVAAAVSTGGTACKPGGRVGDSPVVGAGFWADDRVGACVTTGVGEALLRQGTARRCVELIAAGRSAADAARIALSELSDHDGDERGAGGLIVVAHSGRAAIAHTSAEMPAGCARTGQAPRTGHAWPDRDVG
jgi:beta-aspartyl-peptidase (threonine type)